MRRFTPRGTPPSGRNGELDIQAGGAAGAPDPPQFFSPDTVAGLLRVNRKTVYAAIASGVLKALRLGRVIRIPAAAILDLAGRGRDAPRR